MGVILGNHLNILPSESFAKYLGQLELAASISVPLQARNQKKE